MPADEHLSQAQQENLITILIWSSEHGQLVSRAVDPALFEGDYQLLATRAVEYWRQYGQPPGHHMPDLIARELEDGSRRAATLQRLLLGMTELHGQLNTEYVLAQLETFTRRQLLTDAVLRAAELISRGAGNDEVDRVLGEALKARVAQFDVGTRLDDDLDPFLEYLSRQRGEFTTGIAPLDQAGIVPARGTVYLFIGGKGRGKTWFLTTLGRQGMLLNKRVLHLSLEISEPEMRLRYYQSLFAVPRHRAQPLQLTRFNRETTPGRHYEQMRGWRTETVRPDDPAGPDFAFDNSEVRAELETRMLKLWPRTENLIIKRFANRTLTIDMLNAYLDSLESGERRWTPDLIVLDYAKLMKLQSSSVKDYRIAIGQNMEALRALAIDRNLALATADQLNRQGYESRTARSSHIGEDWSQNFTADVVLVHSATDSEYQKGLGRINVDHARTEADKFNILLSQSYATGQFCLDAARMPGNYMSEMMPGRPGAPPAETAVDVPPEGEDRTPLLGAAADNAGEED